MQKCSKVGWYQLLWNTNNQDSDNQVKGNDFVWVRVRFMVLREKVNIVKKTSMVAASLLFSVAIACAQTPPVSLANPLQGTDSQFSFSHGNLYPAIALPFPMNVWAPYTEPQDDSFYYQYRHHKIFGIRQTHQPSPWMGDYANFSLMPVSGKLVVTDDERASVFRHEDEFATPCYYLVHLDTWNATVEVTPTLRAARFRFTFENPTASYVVLDVFKSDKFSSVKIAPSQNKIVGIARNNHGGVPDNFGNYFVIQFDQPFSAFGVWSNATIQSNVTTLTGTHVGTFLKFDTTKSKVIGCKVASSFISPGQAELNLQREIVIQRYRRLAPMSSVHIHTPVSHSSIPGQRCATPPQHNPRERTT